MVYDMMIQNASSQDREWELLFGAGVKDPTVFSHFMTNVRKYGFYRRIRSHVAFRAQGALRADANRYLGVATLQRFGSKAVAARDSRSSQVRSSRLSAL
jgi:hypothetical protein